MTQPQAPHDTDTADARAMLGAGYEQPPAKEIFGTISGYTPTPDVLCKKYSHVTAQVWGRMWRYCQGRDGVCRAKLETIAGSMGLSERTVIRHIEILVINGYMRDTTPDLKNRPHIYADTGKLRLAFSTDIVESGVTESQSTMTESHRQGDRESVEDSIIKRVVKKPLSTAKIQKIKTAADKTVDGILGFEKKAPGKSWTKLPENYHPFGKAFCDATGLTYTKADFYKWIGAFDTWQSKNFSPQHVTDAIEELKHDGKAGQVSGPSSITWKLEAMSVARHARDEKEVSRNEAQPEETELARRLRTGDYVPRPERAHAI